MLALSVGKANVPMERWSLSMMVAWQPSEFGVLLQEPDLSFEASGERDIASVHAGDQLASRYCESAIQRSHSSGDHAGRCRLAG